VGGGKIFEDSRKQSGDESKKIKYFEGHPGMDQFRDKVHIPLKACIGDRTDSIFKPQALFFPFGDFPVDDHMLPFLH
jgi:hypothetical protein